MKKLSLALLFSWITCLSFAQDRTDTIVFRKNLIHFQPIELGLNSISFQYERMINPRNSVIIGVGIPNYQSVIGKYGIDDTGDLNKLSFSTMHIRGAYRHYTGVSMLPKGFYVEPYLKYQRLEANARVQGTTSDYNIPYYSTMDSKINTVNFGIQLGVQFLIAKIVSLDFYFFGVEGGLANGDLTARSEQLQYVGNVEQDVRKAIDDLPFFLRNRMTVKQTGDKVNVKADNILYPWYRGGISIGIAF